MSDPEKLGKYEIVSRLGRGAMGVVYKGFDPLIERTVAIKTVRKDSLDQEEAETLLARFKREAQAAGRLIHPNIVTVYEYGEDADTAFIAMEYVEGRELKDILDNNERFAIGEVVGIMTQLLDALEYSHAHGVVHRDIKPGNIILLDDGRIKVTDFGIARIESSTLTQFGDVMGTPSYMSPEQFMGQTVDARSDIFSAGVILYHLLTGEKPFPGSSMATIMHRVMKIDPIKPSDLNFHVPAAMDYCTEKALAKQPEQRFQSAAEFARALRNAGAGKEVEEASGAPPRLGTKSDETVLMRADDATVYEPAAARPAPPRPAVGRERRRGGPVVAVAAAIALVFAAVAGAWFWMSGKKGGGTAALAPGAAVTRTVPQGKKTENPKVIKPRKNKVAAARPARKTGRAGGGKRAQSGSARPAGVRISTGVRHGAAPKPLAVPAEPVRDITPPQHAAAVRTAPASPGRPAAPVGASAQVTAVAVSSVEPPAQTREAPAPAARPEKKEEPDYPRLKNRGFGRMLSEDEW